MLSPITFVAIVSEIVHFQAMSEDYIDLDELRQRSVEAILGAFFWCCLVLIDTAFRW